MRKHYKIISVFYLFLSILCAWKAIEIGWLSSFPNVSVEDKSVMQKQHWIHIIVSTVLFIISISNFFYNIFND
jgi:hypothetical protein